MSRGRGRVERAVLDALVRAGGELGVGELGRLVEAHRANRRRAVRALIRRGDVAEGTGPGGERRLRLGERLACLPLLAAMPPLPPPPKRPEEPLEERIARRTAELRAEREAAVPAFYRHDVVGGPSRRLLEPGPAQRRVLYALWRFADPVDVGLPVEALKAIVGGDRSNTRRAIRSLLAHGRVEASEDGGRLRLSFPEARTCSWYERVGLPPVDLRGADPPDDAHARTVLEKLEHDGEGVVALSG